MKRKLFRESKSRLAKLGAPKPAAQKRCPGRPRLHPDISPRATGCTLLPQGAHSHSQKPTVKPGPGGQPRHLCPVTVSLLSLNLGLNLSFFRHVTLSGHTCNRCLFIWGVLSPRGNTGGNQGRGSECESNFKLNAGTWHQRRACPGLCTAWPHEGHLPPGRETSTVVCDSEPTHVVQRTRMKNQPSPPRSGT